MFEIKVHVAKRERDAAAIERFWTLMEEVVEREMRIVQSDVISMTVSGSVAAEYSIGASHTLNSAKAVLRNTSKAWYWEEHGQEAMMWFPNWKDSRLFYWANSPFLAALKVFLYGFEGKHGVEKAVEANRARVDMAIRQAVYTNLRASVLGKKTF